MSDLFEQLITPVPVYGTLNPAEESRLYHEDKATWLKYAGGHLARMLVEYTDELMCDSWRRMSTEYRAAVWPKFSPADQVRLRTALANLQEPAL